MSNHEKAIITYEILQKRRAAKKKAQERMVDEVHYALSAHCAKLSSNRHPGRGVRQSKFIPY